MQVGHKLEAPALKMWSIFWALIPCSDYCRIGIHVGADGPPICYYYMYTNMAKITGKKYVTMYWHGCLGYTGSIVIHIIEKVFF